MPTEDYDASNDCTFVKQRLDDEDNSQSFGRNSTIRKQSAGLIETHKDAYISGKTEYASKTCTVL